MTAKQLPLALSLPAAETFATWVSGDNAEALSMLRDSAHSLIYVWGPTGVGKSHLLHALCADSESIVYLPLKELVGVVDAQCLQGLESYQWVCLDDIDAALHQPAWCLELFSLYNRIDDLAVGTLVVTAQQSPSQLHVQLADLKSRLQWGLTLQLQSLDDSQKVQAMQLRAKAMGLHLSADTAQFMVQRLPREMSHLVEALQQLDQASIAAKRPLTIPFVKAVLGL